MKSQLFEILYFLKNPSAFLVKKSVFSSKKGLLYAYANEIVIISYLLLALIIFSIVREFINFAGLTILSDAFPKQIKFDQDLTLKTFLTLIWAPIFEETLTRGFLNLKGAYVWVSALFILFGIQMYFYPVLPGMEVLTNIILYLFVCTFIGISLAKFFKRATDNFIERFLRPNFNLLLYISLVGFGFFHIVNFEITSGWQYLLTPLLTLPQLIASVFLCFVRVNYGLAFSIALHFLNNLLPTIATLPGEFDKPYLALPIFVVVAYLVRKIWKQSNNRTPIEE